MIERRPWLCLGKRCVARYQDELKANCTCGRVQRMIQLRKLCLVAQLILSRFRVGNALREIEGHVTN
jgi:hypothetical protein